MTPWLEADVHMVAYQNIAKGFGKAPFIGIHVRRGDKISTHEAKLVETEVSYTSTQRTQAHSLEWRRFYGFVIFFVSQVSHRNVVS